MKKLVLVIITMFIFSGLSLNAADDVQLNFQPDLLSGDTKLACEAILCLSSSTRPGECSPSLNRYFSIKAKKWKDTVKARRNFLKLCPVGDEAQKDATFVDLRDNVLPNVDARKCNATYINLNPEKKCVRESCGERRCHCVEYEYRPAIKMPVGCEALIRHAYTDIRPVYICNTTRWYSEEEWKTAKKDCWINKD